jgi:O-acetyl-ADP-ribose deacetylase (regulator of RNase III)
MEECAEIMLAEAADHLKRGTSLEKIYFVLFDDAALKVFKKVWQRLETKAKK